MRIHMTVLKPVDSHTHSHRGSKAGVYQSFSSDKFLCRDVRHEVDIQLKSDQSKGGPHKSGVAWIVKANI
jgi:hypothetical protein